MTRRRLVIAEPAPELQRLVGGKSATRASKIAEEEQSGAIVGMRPFGAAAFDEFVVVQRAGPGFPDDSCREVDLELVCHLVIARRDRPVGSRILCLKVAHAERSDAVCNWR